MATTAATSSDQDSLEMQHPPTSRTRTRKIVRKEVVWLLQFYNLHFAFGQPLALHSKCFCLRNVFAFGGRPSPLPSKGYCLYLRRDFAFAIEGQLPSKSICHRGAPLTSKCPCLCFYHRSVFASIEGHLPSKSLGHRKAFAFKMPLPLPLKGLCLQRVLAFAIESPLQSKVFCHRRAFAFKGHTLCVITRWQDQY